MRSALVAASLLSLVCAGCSTLSSLKSRPVLYAAGDKATLGPLTYSVTDTEVAQELGDDPATARTPKDRFFLITVSVTNSGGEDQPIPSMTLIDDAGTNYNELADGTNVKKWLGVVRKVGPAQTEQGVILFDAPTRHFRLRLNDPFDEREVAIDVPLNFIHEHGQNLSPEDAPVAPQLPVHH